MDGNLMADNLTKEQRVKNMKAIKSQSKLENKVSKKLWNMGFRFRKNTNLFGKPDISIKKYKIVIFIDSCFWHCCPIHGNMPKSNEDYWQNKLDRNKKRDIEVNAYYQKNEWNIIRIWEHEFKDDFELAVSKIALFIQSNLSKTNR
jgi:DNA mismatch endonuclease, patch repair protein